MLFQLNTGFSDSFLKILCALKDEKADKAEPQNRDCGDRQQHIAYKAYKPGTGRRAELTHTSIPSQSGAAPG